ncbi:hypothetical protein K490DRAFT_34264 [Saccharata proteae CBS 121410]|uniref:CMP/dCMP-type deaminase domain-containing protein n=1 Tax=Saccharata proteae CBS 121410 TaxID=1314787 RepID=A0A9P4I0X0_9PEZI|nr:hypothetical protein K490DRAFT_34264 [Saccharata proteae CBS 121410]
MTTNPLASSAIPAVGLHGDTSLDVCNVVPQKGRLVPLKTKGEIKASNETINVHVVELPARAANAVLSVLKSALPEDAVQDLQHLRRVIKPSFLPPHLQSSLFPNAAEASTESRLLLVSPTTTIPLEQLVAALSAHEPFISSPPKIYDLPVPSLAPISAEQAESWSDTYWPVAYKHTNPFGPHPSIVSRTQAEIEAEAGRYLALADIAARETREKGFGEHVGAVAVERLVDAKGRPLAPAEVVAVAGDGRWRGLQGDVTSSTESGVENQHEDGRCNGNVMTHAALRAIALVAQKRLRTAGSSPLDSPAIFADTPLTELEEAVFSRDNLRPNGYLCSELEIYLTREPCVMCSMAILHSRFGRCVFGKRMPLTGAMTADGDGLEHGLFWRPAELNWKFLAWEWQSEEDSSVI